MDVSLLSRESRPPPIVEPRTRLGLDAESTRLAIIGAQHIGLPTSGSPNITTATTSASWVGDVVVEAVMAYNTRNLLKKRLALHVLTHWADRAPPGSLMLAANAFQKDCSDPNPDVRALGTQGMCEVLSQVLSSSGRTRGHPLDDGARELLELSSPLLRYTLRDPNARVRGTTIAGLAKLTRAVASGGAPGVARIICSVFTDSWNENATLMQVAKSTFQSLAIGSTEPTTVVLRAIFALRLLSHFPSAEPLWEPHISQAVVMHDLLLRALSSIDVTEAISWLTLLRRSIDHLAPHWYEVAERGDEVRRELLDVMNHLDPWLFHSNSCVLVEVVRIFVAAACKSSSSTSASSSFPTPVTTSLFADVLETCLTQLVSWLELRRNDGQTGNAEMEIVWRCISSLCVSFAEAGNCMLEKIVHLGRILQWDEHDNKSIFRNKCRILNALSEYAAQPTLPNTPLWHTAVVNLVRMALENNSDETRQIAVRTLAALDERCGEASYALAAVLDFAETALTTTIEIGATNTVAIARITTNVLVLTELLSQTAKLQLAPEAVPQTLKIHQLLLTLNGLIAVANNRSAARIDDATIWKSSLDQMSENSRLLLVCSLQRLMTVAESPQKEEVLELVVGMMELGHSAIGKLGVMLLRSEGSYSSIQLKSRLLPALRPASTAHVAQLVPLPSLGRPPNSSAIRISPLVISARLFKQLWQAMEVAFDAELTWTNSEAIPADIRAVFTGAEIDSCARLVAHSSTRILLASIMTQQDHTSSTLLTEIALDRQSFSTRITIRQNSRATSTKENFVAYSQLFLSRLKTAGATSLN